MFVCDSVCPEPSKAYIYIYIYIYTYIRLHTKHAYAGIHAYASSCKNTCPSKHSPSLKCAHICLHTHTYTQIRHSLTFRHTLIDLRHLLHTHTHCSQTHTRSLLLHSKTLAINIRKLLTILTNTYSTLKTTFITNQKRKRQENTNRLIQ